MHQFVSTSTYPRSVAGKFVYFRLKSPIHSDHTRQSEIITSPYTRRFD